ncbi:oxygenase [Kibdelosporangium aridum]|uniref:Oxygenase n=1 Tax=Kibdelosporangium aridum TaxID=2030 RepID=A0A428Z538_KIBAR|nr:styrene monooxygenase/indole monooxygenase family protein [Kibdelosporangium aridum]RSM81939.1 oxygenase [Kibdelosporangium aridum]
MRVLVVGAGQAGLATACGLAQTDGVEVTVMSHKTPDEIRKGHVLSTQVIFGHGLTFERELGINFWEEIAPDIGGIGLSAMAPGVPMEQQPVIDWWAPLELTAQSVDQRIKFAGLLEYLKGLPGATVITNFTTSGELARTAGKYDLVLVGAGKSELVKMFGRDDERSSYTKPQRALSVVYVNGVEPGATDPDHPIVRFNATPWGELFMIPGLTKSGPCDILFIEARPDGPLDRFEPGTGERILSPDEHLRRFKDALREHFPWQYERCRKAELADPTAYLAGRYVPTIREPLLRIDAEHSVLAIGDVFVQQDPIAGQGANMATWNAKVVVEAVRERLREGGPFDDAWKLATAERQWAIARHSVRFSNTLLDPPEYVLGALGAAGQFPDVRRWLVNGFAQPSDFADRLYDPAALQRYLAGAAGAA